MQPSRAVERQLDSPLWPYVCSLGMMTAFALITGWLGYACTADTAPACPFDPGFEWLSDLGLMRDPNTVPSSFLSQQSELSLH